MSTAPVVCSCLDPDPHVIARSRTFDGVMLELWSDGDITGRLGRYPPGIGHTRNKELAQSVARAVWGNLALYEWHEIADLVRHARRVLSA